MVEQYIGITSANFHGIEIGMIYIVQQRYLLGGVGWISIIDENGTEHNLKESTFKSFVQ